MVALRQRQEGGLRLIGEAEIGRFDALEEEIGINSKGNARLMFSPIRYGGALDIPAVVGEAKCSQDDLLCRKAVIVDSTNHEKFIP